MNDFIEQRLAAIRDDRRKGASQLAGDGLRIMAEALRKSAPGGARKTLALLSGITARLMEVRPSMAPIGSWALEFYALVEGELEGGEGPVGESIPERLAGIILRKKQNVADSLTHEAKKLLSAKNSVFTLSYSSTLDTILTESSSAEMEVVVAESRPLLEGRRLVTSVLASGRKARLVTDAMAGLVIRGVDMVLIGADSICSDLAVVNKVGSYTAALAARETGVPLVVAADTYKINWRADSISVKLEEKPGREIWEEMAGVCQNVYFETVPHPLIAGYLTEKGLLSHDDMTKEVGNRRALAEKVFPGGRL